MKKKLIDLLNSFMKAAGPQWKEELNDIIRDQGKSEEKELEKSFDQIFLSLRRAIIADSTEELEE